MAPAPSISANMLPDLRLVQALNEPEGKTASGHKKIERPRQSLSRSGSVRSVSKNAQEDVECPAKPSVARPPAAWRMEASCSIASYLVCSISMVLLNKMVTSPQRHGFNYPMMLIFFQNLSAVLAVVFARQVGWIDYPGLNWPFVRRWLPLTVIFTMMLATSLMSLRTMSVAMVTLIKAFAIICTALGDHLLFGHPLTAMMILSFVLMYVGSCLGGGTDAWITPEGLFYSVLNVFCTSGYQLYMKGMLQDVKDQLGRWGPVFYNNLLSLPMLIIPTVLTASGHQGWMAALQVADVWAQGWIGAMCILSPFMTMSSFWCITATSPTTFAVVGGMNKIPLAIFGMFLFNQWPSTAGTAGLCIGISAGFFYTWAMQRSKVAQDESVSPSTLKRIGSALVLSSVVFVWLLYSLFSKSLT